MTKPLNEFGKHKLAKAGVCWCKQCNREASLAWNEKLKAEVFAHYGGRCGHCGESDIDVLTMDHADQNGSEHKKKFGLTSGSKTWRWLKLNGYPKNFRLLCFNCNVKAWRLHLRQQRNQK